jgi:hypothetical protein
LLSPVKLSGKRGQLLLSPTSRGALAEQLRSPEGAPLGEAFSFVSGLYFRGKLAYARAFGSALGAEPGAFIISAGGGLCRLDEPVTTARLSAWASVDIDEQNPHFAIPLVRHTSELLDRYPASARFVLLGSLASNKYVAPLLEVLGSRALFPSLFLGMGDMQRGSVLLEAARQGRELAYEPLAGARRR